MEDSVREWIVKNLALFLDEETRPQLEFSHLYTLQQYKSTTDPRLWRELRKEARRTISARAADLSDSFSSANRSLSEGQGSENFQGIVECRADEHATPPSKSRRGRRSRKCNSYQVDEHEKLGMDRTDLTGMFDSSMSGGVLMSTEHKVTGGAEVSPKIAFEEKERAEEGGDVVPEYVDTESLAVGSLVVTSDSSLSNSMTQLHLSSSSASPLVEERCWCEVCAEKGKQLEGRLQHALEQLALAQQEASEWRTRALAQQHSFLSPDRSEQRQGCGGRFLTDSTPPMLSKSLSSPMVKSLTETISAEASSIEMLTKALLEGEEEDFSNINEILKRVKGLKKDINAVSSLVSKSRRDELHKMLEQLGAHQDFLGSLAVEMKGMEWSEKEKEFEAKIGALFDVVDVERNGNCLFTCAALHSKALESDGGSKMLAALSREERRNLSLELRAQAIALLLQSNLNESIRTDIADSLQDALYGNRSDRTSKLLREEAQRRWGKQVLSSPVSREKLLSQTAVELYASVMARDGIFGERVELQVLSSLFAAPVHLFYFVHGQTPSPSSPTEILGGDKEGKPLVLLHSSRESHYQLLLSKEDAEAPLPAYYCETPPRPKGWRKYLCNM